MRSGELIINKRMRMSDLSLYRITENLKEVEQKLIESGGEVSEEIEDTLVTLQNELVQKTDGVAEWMMSLKDKLEIIEKRRKELQEIERTAKNQYDSFVNYVATCMKRLDLTKVEGKIHRVTLRKPTLSVEITDETKIPNEFVVSKKVYSVDKKALKEALKNKSIDGAELKPSKPSLLIK